MVDHKIERALYQVSSSIVGNSMRTGSKDKELVELRRKQIARCAMSVMIKKSSSQTGVREIAAACGMSMGALYNYVGAKEDILYLVLKEGLSEFKEFHSKVSTKFITMEPVAALREAIDCYCKLVDLSSNCLLFAYLETKTLPTQYRNSSLDSEVKAVSRFEELLVRGCKEGEFDVPDPHLIALNITTICEMWAVRRWFIEKDMCLQDYISSQTEYILRSIVNHSECSKDAS
jgi:TetR/AcrR family transcriptional regulator, cholesterol catabolism regulator